MKLKGKLTMLVNRDYTSIQIEDADANICFARIKLTPEQLSEALSRLAFVECELEVSGLDKVGKKHENKDFVFEIDKEQYRARNDAELQKIAQSKLTDGWIADGYFISQNSFFTKEDRYYARCVIRRWV